MQHCHRLLLLSLAAGGRVAVGFTPKDSAHCVRWTAAELPSPIPTEAKGGGAPADGDSDRGPLLCRAARSTDAAAAAASSCAAEADAPIGVASVHLDVGVVGADGACMPLSQPAPGALASLRQPDALRLGGALEYARVDSECDVWWREVSQDVIPPIPELVLPFGATPGGDKLAICRSERPVRPSSPRCPAPQRSAHARGD